MHSVFSQEFAEHGMSNVTLTHRNVCKDGFTVLDTADAGNYTQSPIFSPCFSLRKTAGRRETESGDDSFRFLVFLDLPAPWEAVQHAKSALRVRQSLPSFPSPCRSLLTSVTRILARKTEPPEFAALVRAWSKF